MRSPVWLRALPPYVILAVAWVVFICLSYPGIMTMDSFDQLEEARAGFYTDSHPPIMAVLWSILDRIIAGPFLMLVIQGTTFIIGLYWILKRAMAPQRAAIVAGGLALFPPMLATMVVVWKDCQMAGFLALGYGILLNDDGTRRWVRFASLGAFFVATAMRYNAFAATLPMIVLCWQWREGMRPLLRYAIASGVWLAITLGAYGFNMLLTDRQMHFWASTYALADIAGTLAHLDETVPDSELGPLLVPTQIRIDHDFHAALRAKYRRETFTPLIGGDDRLWDVPIRGTTPSPVEQRDAIGHAWREIVTSHPWAYVQHRFASFSEVLGIHKKFWGAIVMTRRHQIPERVAELGIHTLRLPMQRTGERVMIWLAKKTPIYRPWIYALLALIMLGFARGHRDVFALLASGLIMELSLLPLAGTPDYRYSHWLVTCTCVAVAMLIARHRQTLASPRPEPGS